MVYTKIGGTVILEKDGLRVRVELDKTILKIEDEINNPYIYEIGEDEKNLYYFKKKNVTKDDYVKSLEGMKNLLISMFSDVPTFDVFEYLAITKKGKFSLNRKVVLASTVVGLFWNYTDYKYIQVPSIEARTLSEDLVDVEFTFSQSDVNKFSPIFFEDYTTPIIREKLSAIKKNDLKPGRIYSDDKKKKYFIYIGKAIYISSVIYKESKALLPAKAFTDVDIESDANEETYRPTTYLYAKLSKKQYEAIKFGETANAKEYLENLLKDKIKDVRLSYTLNPPKVYYEEKDYLEGNSSFRVINRGERELLDNTKGEISEDMPRKSFTALAYDYIQMID